MTQTRHIAHIVIEAETPIKVGSNASDFWQDAPVQKDWNGLPMILGTSIAGVLRKDFDETKVADIFGKDTGSKVIISNALLCINDNNEVCEELLLEKSDFLQIFDHLPIREHTAIDHKGVVKDGAKFDEEVVYKGSRFKFSIEFIEDETTFEAILTLLKNPAFRLGGGSTKGFGKFKVHKLTRASLKLDGYSSSLNTSISEQPESNEPKKQSSTQTTYSLTIKPDDFFMFGSGFGDGDADMTPVYEKVVDYEKGKLSNLQVLIPASSIKGAIAHRTAFYYNKKMLEEGKDHTRVGEKNEAVKAIFGHKKELSSDKKTELGQKGKILISDCFKRDSGKTKTFDHVSIDRFTGGAIDGALFQEKMVARDGDDYTIEILLEKVDNEMVIKAFELALKDIVKGMLPLGGATTKGHGVFTGTITRNGVAL